MDVELPDGTVIEGVPDGTTRAQLLRKLFDAKHPAYATLAKEGLTKEGWGSGFGRLANEIGGRVTDLSAKWGATPERAAAEGFIGNVATQAIPAILGGARMAGAEPVSLAEKPAKLLMQSAVKPAQADRASGAAGKAMSAMLREDIPPTISGMDKASSLARSLDDTAETAISGSPATVSLNSVGQRLQGPARNAITQANPQDDIEVVKSVWNKFKTSPLVKEQAEIQARAAQASPGAAASGDVSLPVKLAHELKKGTYRSLGGKAYGEIGSVSTESQKALARGLREDVASAVPEAADALKRESELMNVLDVARNRVLLEANKNPAGLGALRIGDNPLSTVGFLADRSAQAKGLLARLLYRGSQPQFAVPYAVAGEAGAGQQGR